MVIAQAGRDHEVVCGLISGVRVVYLVVVNVMRKMWFGLKLEMTGKARRREGSVQSQP